MTPPRAQKESPARLSSLRGFSFPAALRVRSVHFHLAMIDLTAAASPPFAGLHVLISGGTTGIGRAIALQLLAGGASVFVFGRHQRALDNVVDEAKGGDLAGITADQADPLDVERVFGEVGLRWPHIDVLINNASLGSEDLAEETDASIACIVNTNVCGYLYCTRQALLRMKKRKAGHIINIGSITAEKLKAGGEVYTATKAAIRGFSESIRKSVQECGIKVTLIEPGKTGTDLIDESIEEQREKEALLEMLKAEDVAEAVCFCLTQSRRAVITSLQIEPFRHQ